MEALVQSLNVAPSTRAISNNNDEVESTFDATTWGSSGGFGNLNAKGHVKGMAFPRVSNPSVFLSNFTDSMSTNAAAPIKLEHGTTTLAFKFQGGIIVCTDSRASAGSYIASGTVKKVIEVTDTMLSTMAGGAADCQYCELGYVGMQCRLYELRNKEKITVAAASKILSNIMYGYKNQGLSMGTMYCGYDAKTGFSIFYCDNDGTRIKGNLFSVGSGATYAYGVLDQGYDYNMTEEDAIALGKRSICAAGHRDAYSGNNIRSYIIREDGWHFLGLEDLSEAWYNAQIREGRPIDGTKAPATPVQAQTGDVQME